MTRMRALAVVLFGLSVVSLEAQAGKVSGTLVVNGKKDPRSTHHCRDLRHALAGTTGQRPGLGQTWPIRKRFGNTRGSGPENATWRA